VSTPANATAPTSDVSGLAPHGLDPRLAELVARRRPRYRQLWRYYRESGEAGRLAPAAAAGPDGGLPARLRRSQGDPASPRSERVIENDIAWRVHGMVDFMVGRPPAIQSTLADPQRAAQIERFLHRVIGDNGGQAFFHALALVGHIYGFADIVLRLDTDPDRPILFDLIDAVCTLPIEDPHDYTALRGYAVCRPEATQPSTGASWLRRVGGRWLGDARPGGGGSIDRLELMTPRQTQLLRRTRSGGFEVTESEPNPLGVLAVVHIQNLPQPFAYEGLSEVEPLIGLQDELNTRLSDRAHRVTLQSFKMYLAKGLDGFGDRPVAPGQMWTTDNPDAAIESFGGDAASPSEDNHIREVREALDKASGISPLITGQLRDRLGNLSSENALRIVTMGLIARTDKKRFTYGEGIRRLMRLALHAADVTGLFPNTPEERQLHLDWPDPMPLGESDRLRNAERKLELGVPRRRVLAELGYTAADLAEDTADAIPTPPDSEE
jgi:hypothetical protein